MIRRLTSRAAMMAAAEAVGAAVSGIPGAGSVIGLGAEWAATGALDAVSGRKRGVVLEGRKHSSVPHDVHVVGKARAVRHQFRREDLDASPFWSEVYGLLCEGRLHDVKGILHIRQVVGPPDDWRFVRKGHVRSAMRMESDRWTDVPCKALLAAATARDMRVILTGEPDFSGTVHDAGNYTSLCVPALGRDGRISHLATVCATESPVKFLDRLGVSGMRKPEVRLSLADIKPAVNRLCGDPMHRHILPSMPQSDAVLGMGERLETGGQRHE